MGLKRKKENDKTQLSKMYLLNVFNGNYIQKVTYVSLKGYMLCNSIDVLDIRKL